MSLSRINLLEEPFQRLRVRPHQGKEAEAEARPTRIRRRGNVRGITVQGADVEAEAELVAVRAEAEAEAEAVFARQEADVCFCFLKEPLKEHHCNALLLMSISVSNSQYRIISSVSVSVVLS
jgi:hypothetical protein